jgi:hypothetical protein
MQLLIETCEFPNNTPPREWLTREETSAPYSIPKRAVCQSGRDYVNKGKAVQALILVPKLRGLTKSNDDAHIDANSLIRDNRERLPFVRIHLAAHSYTSRTYVANGSGTR